MNDSKELYRAYESDKKQFYDECGSNNLTADQVIKLYLAVTFAEHQFLRVCKADIEVVLNNQDRMNELCNQTVNRLNSLYESKSERLNDHSQNGIQFNPKQNSINAQSATKRIIMVYI